uniref:Uncharacterized protein n=1 Tax=Arcella intermedia TaxID=1963864 RepID=A0A6B2LE56_9EUKA
MLKNVGTPIFKSRGDKGIEERRVYYSSTAGLAYRNKLKEQYDALLDFFTQCSQNEISVSAYMKLKGWNLKVLDILPSILVDACNANQFDVVSFLLDQGENPNVQDFKQVSPLYAACSITSLPLISRLYKAGASFRIRSNGQLPLDVCSSKFVVTVLKELSWEKVRLIYIGHFEKGCLFSILPRDVVGRIEKEILMQFKNYLETK